MRLRGVFLSFAVAATAGMMLLFAGPAAASNLYCGETLTASVTLIGTLDCHNYNGNAITIGKDGVTLYLNGQSIIGSDYGWDVIEVDGGYSGFTVQTGTLVVNDNGTGIDGGGADSMTVNDVTITGNGANTSEGIYSGGALGLMVNGATVSGFKNGVYLDETIGATVQGSTITTFDPSGADLSSNRCAGVYEAYGTNDMITGNTFTSAAPGTCYGTRVDHSAGTVFSGNTATALYRGFGSHRFGAGLQITGNVFGGAAPATGNLWGIYLNDHDSGDVISGNYVRNSYYNGVYDEDSFNNTYVGNVVTANGRAANWSGIWINSGGHGPVTMVNNVSRVSAGSGFHIDEAYNSSVPGGPYSLFTGNIATANGNNDNLPGFRDYYSVGATWSNNVAYSNAYDGFWFTRPWRETITGNSAKMNGSDGFEIYDNDSNHQTLAFTNNSATYNGNLGFDADYPVAGSGNTGGGTNGAGVDCYLVSGCS